jgi:hypothetical protein
MTGIMDDPCFCVGPWRDTEPADRPETVLGREHQIGSVGCEHGYALADSPPMKLFVFRFRDGRRVEFTAFSMKVACDWAAEQGKVSSWSASVTDGKVLAPKWG